MTLVSLRKVLEFSVDWQLIMLVLRPERLVINKLKQKDKEES